MPRALRVHAPGVFYHATARGNHRENIFETPADRDYLSLLIQKAITKDGARVLAFCYMTNHLHLFIQVSEERLGKIMQQILTGYAKYRHSLMQTTGHLFEQHHGAFP